MKALVENGADFGALTRDGKLPRELVPDQRMAMEFSCVQEDFDFTPPEMFSRKSILVALQSDEKCWLHTLVRTVERHSRSVGPLLTIETKRIDHPATRCRVWSARATADRLAFAC